MSDDWIVTFRRAEENEPEYTSDPRTILALPKDQRLDAIADIFRQLSSRYSAATASDDMKVAQDSAIEAVRVITALYPERDDEGHKLIAALLGALVAARSGSNRHILLRPGLRIAGTKRGLGATAISAGAVAAVWALEARGMSKLAARSRVAAMLTDQGYSLRKDDHGQPLPLTTSALRAWEEQPDRYPIVASWSPEYLRIIEEHIASQGLETVEQVAALLESLTPEFLKNHVAL